MPAATHDNEIIATLLVSVLLIVLLAGALMAALTLSLLRRREEAEPAMTAVSSPTASARPPGPRRRF